MVKIRDGRLPDEARIKCLNVPFFLTTALGRTTFFRLGYLNIFCPQIVRRQYKKAGTFCQKAILKKKKCKLILTSQFTERESLAFINTVRRQCNVPIYQC